MLLNTAGACAQEQHRRHDCDHYSEAAVPILNPHQVILGKVQAVGLRQQRHQLQLCALIVKHRYLSAKSHHGKTWLQCT